MPVAPPSRRPHRTADYRVEFRSGDTTRVIAADVVPLEPIAFRLAATGASGVLAVVDERTGADVICWPLRPETACDTN